MQLRREFELPEPDREFLDAHSDRWETVVEGKTRWVILHDHAVPKGYTHDQVALALMIPPGYPDAPLDMFYVKPALARRDGKAINALKNQSIRGEPFQRWSRHRTSANPWRVGEDDISTQVVLADALLAREIGSLN
ncbi:MAG: E2/UBC family protein [Phycisphaerales bacterium]